MRRRLLLWSSLWLLQSHVEAHEQLRSRPSDAITQVSRELAEGANPGSTCSAAGSFLGVGNTACLHDNLGAAIFLLAVIVLVSTAFERFIHYTRRAIKCPQLRRIVGRIFQEIMILGFLSMVIFTLNTTGAFEALSAASLAFADELSGSERLHFYEFFHYVVFLTMIYFIAIVLLLLFIGTVAPKLVWETKVHRGGLRRYQLESDDEDRLDYYHHDSDDDNDDINNNNRSINGSSRRKMMFDSNGNPANTPQDSTLSDDEDGSRYYVRPSHQFSWCRQDARNDMMRSFATMRERSKSGMDLALGARAYSLLLHRYQRESGWYFRLNLRKQWQLYKSFELLAYNICQNRSGYIYKNAKEMERLFDVRPAAATHSPLEMLDDQCITGGEDDICSPPPGPPFTFEEYHVLCMRNLLFHITELHPSAFVILVVISVLPSAFPAYAHWIFIGVGALLLLINVVILFKVFRILRGIVDDRLRVFTMREIQARMDRKAARQGGGASQSQLHPRKRTFKAAALAVRAILRMQMSALCHRALHHHDHLFWLSSPKLLLRLFQFATIGQAFYLVWLSLVETQAVLHESSPAAKWYYMTIMLALPALALFVVTPMTMPSLVLVMSLTGIFAELNAETEEGGVLKKSSKRTMQEESKIRMRMMRRSYLRSHYSDDDDRYISRLNIGHNSSSSNNNNNFSLEDGVSSSDRLVRGSRTTNPPCVEGVTAEAQSNVNDVGNAEAGLMSPTNSVFLRIYDSPTAAVQQSKMALADRMLSPSLRRSDGDRRSLLGRSRRGTQASNSRRYSRESGRSRSSSYNSDTITSNHSYRSLGYSSSVGRNGTTSSYYNSRGGSWGRATPKHNSFGSFGRDDSGYSGASRHFDLAAFQAAGGNARTALNSVYHSPRRSRNRPEWSQAPMESITKPGNQEPQQESHFSVPSASSSNNDDATDQSNRKTGEDPDPLSPAASTFKSYCSKYGGYPEQ